jgi:Fe-S-cluster containining protein
MTDTRQFVSSPYVPPPAAWLCLECAKEGKTCCRTELYLATLCFPLSVPEWRRLTPYAELAVPHVPADGVIFAETEAAADAAALAIEPSAEALGDMPPPDDPEDRRTPPTEGDALCAAELNVPEFISSMHEMFPGDKKRVNALFPAKGKHFTLRIKKDGSCIFLGAAGCRLPRAARPWYCRLFPAWVVEGSLTLFLLQDCLISQRAKNPDDCLRMMGASPAHIRALHKRLCADWGFD